MPASPLRYRMFFAACVLAADFSSCASMTMAQLPNPPAGRVSPPSGIVLNSNFNLEIDYRFRYESRNTSDFYARQTNDPRDDLDRLRVGLRWKNKQGASVFLQPQYAYGHDTNAFKSAGTYNDLDFHQGYAQFDTHNRRLRLGRQELNYGDYRLLGPGDWSNVGRSWDAALFSLTRKSTTTDFFVGKLGLYQGKTSDPVIAGIYSTTIQTKQNSYELYLLAKSERASGEIQEVYTFGARPKFVFWKRFDATIEPVVQFGHQGIRAIQAWAYAANVGYTFPGRSAFRLAVESDYASGGNPTGTGTIHTFDQLYPTNHRAYGIIDYVGWRNIQDIRLSAYVKPQRRWTTTLDAHFFQLADSRDYWYSDNDKPMKGANGSSLRDPTGAAGRDLGAEVDFTVGYAVSKNINLLAGYCRFMPGEFVRKTNAGHADDSDWLFFQTVITF